MNSYPESLLSLVSEAASKNPDSIENAVSQAFDAWRVHPDYPDHVHDLVRGMLQELVYRVRHSKNVDLRRESRAYVQQPKVGLSTGAVNAVAMECYLEYSIGGRALGMVLGSELTAIGTAERERANGHAFNARLCEHLASIVSSDKSVGECVSEQRLKRIFNELRGQRRTTAKVSPKSTAGMPSSGPGAIAARKKHTAASPA